MTGPLTAPVRRQPLVAQVAEQFREQIRTGVWALGERIPGEHALATELGVSRGTVREALRALTLAGLLDPRVGDGTYVSGTSDLAATLRRETDGAGDLAHAIDLRAVLDGAAARRAAAQATAPQLDHIDRLLADRRTAHDSGDPAAFTAADTAFHRAIAMASGNPLLARIYDAVGDLVSDSIRRTTELPEDPALHELHRSLAAAVRAGDPDAAERAATALLQDVSFLDAARREQS
ncbi:FCD domain-containing protein [Nakamurella sp. YIM 132087]|uniref:FCD domain-containing protein n=1 Tax=Nakamurella alba TaxID=2665158 RepID=A0A7K1FLQ7_9ACTN|nr:FCD domain-containing protein [Nakamurella alba]MTD15048.1 FCD domain-containing protein [Nakamurella alba]